MKLSPHSSLCLCHQANSANSLCHSAQAVSCCFFVEAVLLSQGVDLQAVRTVKGSTCGLLRSRWQRVLGVLRAWRERQGLALSIPFEGLKTTTNRRGEWAEASQAYGKCISLLMHLTANACMACCMACSCGLLTAMRSRQVVMLSTQQPVLCSAAAGHGFTQPYQLW